MAHPAETAVACAPPAPAVRDADRDALHVLPLAIVPLHTPPLARARLIKNANLETVVELFSDARTGSGQIDIEDVPGEFGWTAPEEHPDLAVLRKLALLPSFDVYSLRILLRKHGIPINDHRALQLSPAKNSELTRYMTEFTRPLIKEIYGSESAQIESFEHLLRMFRQPDAQKAVARLRMLAERLQIRVTQVPRFLEDYGDIFLSLSYYREALERLGPAIESFRGSLNEMRKHQQIAQDRQTLATCKTVYEVLAHALTTVRLRLDHFGERTRDLWTDVSAEAFREIRALITRSHTTIGGILCALVVKMDAWTAAFPYESSGGLMRRADFIVNDMRRGIEKIRHIEAAAPALTQAGSTPPPPQARRVPGASG